MSTMRLNFERPMILLFGMYPMWAYPTNGKRWCSHREYIGMFHWQTIWSAPSASKDVILGRSRYPDVRSHIERATRVGV